VDTVYIFISPSGSKENNNMLIKCTKSHNGNRPRSRIIEQKTARGLKPKIY